MRNALAVHDYKQEANERRREEQEKIPYITKSKLNSKLNVLFWII